MKSTKQSIKSFSRRVNTLLPRLREKCRRITAPIKERFAGHDGRGVKFRPTANFAIYIAMLIFAIVFTQTLRSSVSAVILVFMIFLPIMALVYLLIGALTIKIYTESDYTEVEKGSPVDFSLTVSNSSPIPFPFVDAMISVPSDDAVRCQRRLTRLSLIPLGSYEIKKTLSFAYRGGYEIGVSDIYISDPMRLFCYRMDVNLSREIFVFPARRTLSGRDGDRLDSDITETVNRHSGNDNTEISDIRNYAPGDSLRAIHWKLSSKTEELLVRQYAKNSEKQTIVICDNAVRYESDPQKYADDINEFAADGIIESVIAIVNALLLTAGSSVTLIWFDDRVSEGYLAARIDSRAAFDEIYRLFATAPIVTTEHEVTSLAEIVSGAVDNATFCFVGGRVSRGLVSSLSTTGVRGGAASEFYTYIPTEKIAESERSRYFEELESSLSELSRQGIKVLDARDGRISGGMTRANAQKEVDQDEG